MIFWKAVILLASLVFVAPPLCAQAVRGELREGESGRPVAGAFVVLLDEGGRQVGGSFTDAAGGFHLQAPAPGRYALRAERVGHVSVRSEVLQLAAGQTLLYGLEMGAAAIQLDGLVVQAERRRCAVLPDAGAQTAAIWEEARKALSATAWTDSGRRFRYTLQHSHRELNVASNRVVSERGERVTGFAVSPFVSVPVERLVNEGFVHVDGDSLVYHAPDAKVLLSDEFLDTHCFRVQPGEGEMAERVGLAFEPVRGRRIPDVRGVLWLDRQTAELRHLEYTYTGLDLAGATDRVGGRVEFERLPSGEWIVPHWRIRMPMVAVESVKLGMQSHMRRRIVGFTEVVGDVLEVRSVQGALIRSTARAALSGTVFDSTRAAPLSGARVRLVGTASEAETDAQGRFRIADVAEGRYSIVFAHPRADTLEHPERPVPVDVRQGAENTVELAVPSLASVLAGRCAPEERRGGTGVVVGEVREEGGVVPPPGTPVLLTWAASGAAPAGRVVAWTDARGHYFACSVPTGVAVETRVGSQASVAVEVRANAERAVRHDLTVPAPQAVVLDGLAVTAEAPAAREARARGTRMDLVLREEIESLRTVARHVGDLMRRFPGVAIQDLSREGSSVIEGVCLRERRGKFGSPCAAVVIDDVVQIDGPRAMMDLPVGDVESVEWFPPIVAMARYGGVARGGAMLVYTVGNGPHAKRPGGE